MFCSQFARSVLLGLSLFSDASLGQPSPKNISQLVAMAKDGDYGAVVAIEKLDLPASRTALHEVMESHKKQLGDRAYDSYFVQRLSFVLARLGEETELQRFLKELDSTDPVAQDNAIRLAREVNSPGVVNKLLTFLDKTAPVEGHHVIGDPVALSAMETLAYLVKNPPIPPGEKVSLADIPKWKRWAETRKTEK